MRRVLALLLMSLTLASPAGAAGPPSKQQQPKKAAVAAAPVVTPSAVLQSPIPLASTTPGGDAGQCRASCAKSYYFCSARDDGDCASQWAQCSARCTATYKRLGS
jgi:hypothetical protein